MTVWKKAHEDLIQDNTFQIGGLYEGTRYEFKASAANSFGESRLVLKVK